MLRRSRLAKGQGRRSCTQGDHAENVRSPDERYWTWTDLHIGCEVDLHCRKLTIHDANEFTRRFYEQQGSPLGPALVINQPPPPDIEGPVPPYNGFGSEEDSIRSFYSIRPTPPKKDLKKLKVLCEFYPEARVVR